MSNNSSSSGGTSIIGLLGVAFVVLKLTGFIDWSWWYVTLPFWGGLVLLIAGISKMKDLYDNEPNQVQNVKKRGFQDRLNQALEEQKKLKNKNLYN
jgi:hypothetical protein